ncbi:MAG TPA: response regulator transcription factor [Chitinophagaceae bacterium]|nr:response regulator transcription factor [Chitinophagaceae bacterium]
MLRILIADDHPIVRRGLKQLLLQAHPSAIIEEVGEAESLVKKALQADWDVIVCDMNMPGRSGLEALEQIKQSKPALPVLIMSMYPEDQYALRALKSGASGYLRKETVDDELVGAIQTVLQGRKYITPSIAEKLADAYKADDSKLPHEHLSNREFEIFKLIAAGKSITDIGDQLSLSVSTVGTYRSRLMVKLNVQSNAELTRYALENKLI